MTDECFLALDTSCYTTSAAIVSGGEVVADKRLALTVQRGSRGLRQSEAVFEHIRNMKQLFLDFGQYSIKAVAYSAKPCPVEGSYMPVFCVCESLGVAMGAALGVPAYALTHQHGHIYSAFFGNTLPDGEVCAFHVSGGTLDILRVAVTDGLVESITPIGGKADITCGQLIDRVGVAAGLEFPSGRAMEKLYRPGGVKLAVHVEGLSANLSGAETQALRLLNEGGDKEAVLSGVIDCVAETLSKLAVNTTKQTGMSRFVFTGGVMCNGIVRERLKEACEHCGATGVFAQKPYCSDNACGLALAAQRIYEKGESG